MRVSYSKNFIKQSKKLTPKIKNQLITKIEQFIKNPNSAALRNHGLSGKYINYRSINISGDLRALYLQKDDEVIFDQIGTHSQLYG